MPTAYKTSAMSRNQPMPTCTGHLVVSYPFSFALTAALAAGDTIHVADLPPDFVPADAVLVCDDLDTNGAPAITLHFGLSDDADAFLASSTVAQAGGVARASAKAGFRVAPSDTARQVLVTVETAPATGATTGTISGVLHYRPARSSE